MIIIQANDGLRRLAGVAWLAATTGPPWLPACHWPLAAGRWLRLAAGCWLWQAERLRRHHKESPPLKRRNQPEVWLTERQSQPKAYVISYHLTEQNKYTGGVSV